jgi:hypothetical protein
MRKILFLILLMAVQGSLFAQFEFPSLSPKGNITQVIGDTHIEVEYERPAARNRVIFGGLVPWNKVWRTGAGYCTKIRFDKPVSVGGQQIEAGHYSLFTIPIPDSWIIIFNTDTTLYGSYRYDAEKDVARFVVDSEKSDRFYETLTIDIDFIPNHAHMYVSWANTQIHFPIHTGTDERVMRFIQEELLTGKEKDPDQYGMGSDYLMYQNQDFSDALALAEMMIQKEGNEGWARIIKLTVYEKLHLYDKALVEIEKGIAHTQVSEYEEEVYRENDLKEWKRHAVRINTAKAATEK